MNDDEGLRIRELKEMMIYDSAPEDCYDDITRLASLIADTEISLITLIDANRLWFKSSCGLNMKESLRENSFCSEVVKLKEILIVDNAKVDRRFCTNALVVDVPNVHFYLGIPLVSTRGIALGTLCVMSSFEKEVSHKQIDGLKLLAAQVVRLLEDRKSFLRSRQEYKQLIDIQLISKTGGWEVDVEESSCLCTKGIYEICSLAEAESMPLEMAYSFYPEEDRERIIQCIEKCAADGTPFDDEFNFVDAKGRKKWVRATGEAVWQNGKVVKLIGILQDITKRKHDEIELKRHALEMETYAKGLDQNILVLKMNSEGMITFANQKFCQISEYPLDQLRGRIPSFLNSGVHPPSFYTDFLCKVKHREQWRGEICLKSHSGKLFWVDTTLTPASNSLDVENTEYISFMYDITSLKKLEQELAVSEHRYRSMFDCSSDAMITLAPPRWQFTSCNTATLNLLDIRSREELLKLSLGDISPHKQPDGLCSNESFRQKIETTVSEGSCFFNWTCTRSTGEPVACTILLSRIYQGDEIFLQATIRDITSQVRAEEELKIKTKELLASKTYLSLALESSNIGIWDWKIASNVIKFDNRWAQLLGFQNSSAEISIKEWQSLLHPDDLHQCIIDVEACLSGRKNFYENIHRVKGQNGSWHYILDRGRVVEKDEDGRPIQLLGTYYDITEQKRKDIIVQNISDIRAKYVEHFDCEDDFIGFFLSRSSEIFNAAEIVLIKLDGEGDQKHYYNPDHSRLLEDYAKSIDHLGEKNEYFHITERIWGYRFFEGEDSLGVLVVLGHQSKVTSEEMLRFKPYLNASCGILSSYFMRNKMKEQAAMAMHHSKMAAIGELAAGVGHEINNPTAVIMGFLSLTEKGIEEKSIELSTIKNNLQKMKLAALRIGNIVRGLKGFAYSDADAMSPVDIGDLVSETVGMLSEIYLKDGVRIQCKLCEKELITDGHRSRLQQVLFNIISNAKDASIGKNERLISIEAKKTTSETILLIISDNGWGISPSIKDRIFDPFYTTKPINIGTGIGLPLVRSILNEHKGKIYFDSKLDIGTEFFLEFPISILHHSTVLVERNGSPDSTEVSSLQERKILVVDDEADLGHVLTCILQRSFAHVSMATSFAEALSLIEENEFDLILSDINMPGGTGFELKKAIHKLKKIPFILMSGNIETDLDEPRRSSAIPDDFLLKPFSEDELISKIQSILVKNVIYE